MQDTPVPPLITAAGLQRLSGHPQLLVVDCRFELTDPAFGRRAYAAGHLPGAVFVSVENDLAAPRGPDTGRHPLPTPEAFARVLARWGFTADSHVVAYDQASGAWAARLWWMLRARGHARVQVLDGGWDAWLAAGGGFETDVPQIAPTMVAPVPFANAMDSAEVANEMARGSIVLVDARAPDRFAGRNEHMDPVAGHVPGAINMPFTGNLGPGGQWRTPDALRQHWQAVLQRADGRAVVAMCGSGITACHNLLALELAGHRDTRLYAGSWSGWITDPARPIATGEEA